LENLKAETLEHVTIEEFLMNLKKEFCREDNETMKVVKLKKIEQRSRKMEKFVQEFRKAARGSEYKERSLVEDFKREINRVIRRKLIEVERPSRSIEKWYERAVCYDRYLLKSAWTWVEGMTTTISCAEVVSVSTSCGRHDILT